MQNFYILHFRKFLKRLFPILPGPVRPLAAGMVGLTGFEPVTLRLSSACSNQLSYRPAAGGARNLKFEICDFNFRAGGAEETRTPDL
jgi:hypothetical protein